MDVVSTLHILNKSPGHGRHAACLSALAADDGLLLIENGVLLLARLRDSTLPCRLYALAPDMDARGISLDENDEESVRRISYEDMVTLTAAADKVISW